MIYQKELGITQWIKLWSKVNCIIGIFFPNKKFADNFKFDENDRKFTKWVENTVGKGEIALYEQFLLFPQYFQKTCIEDR